MQRSDLFKKAIYIINVLLIICFILLMIFKSKIFYSIYWVILPVLFLFAILFVKEVDKGDVNVDYYKSMNLRSIYNDGTTIPMVLYGILYLIIEFADIFYDNIKNNINLVCIMFFATLVYELLTIMLLNKVQKNTSAKLDKKGKK